MASHSTGKYRNALSFKGPLFYFNYMPQIFALFQNNFKKSNIMPVKLFKQYAKSFALDLQNSGSPEEWEGPNAPLYYVPGLPRDHRKNIQTVIYKENL